MVLANLCSPPPNTSAPHQNPHATKETCLNAETIQLGPADPPTQNKQTTLSPSHPQFQLSILTRLMASYHNNGHRKLDRQFVGKENKMQNREEWYDSVTITVKTNPLWPPSLSHSPSQPYLMVSWRCCSIAHPLESYPARRGQRWLAQTYRRFKIPPKYHPRSPEKRAWNPDEIKYSQPTSCRWREPDIPEAFTSSACLCWHLARPLRPPEVPRAHRVEVETRAPNHYYWLLEKSLKPS